MKSIVCRMMLTSLGMTASAAFAADPCDSPYFKNVPFRRTLSAQNAQLSIFNEARFAYDCKSLAAETRGGINIAFYKLNSDVWSIQAAAIQDENDAEVSIRSLLLGFELGNEHHSLGSLYDKTFSTDQDIDLSDKMTVAIGPLPVDIRYGIEGSGNVRVKAGVKNFGAQLGVIPSSKVRAYVQAGADVQIITASARGELQVLDGKLDNVLSARYRSKDHRQGATIAATSYADFAALDGTVKGRLETHTGKNDQEFQKEFFRWDGQRFAAKVIDFSKDIFLPSESEGPGESSPGHEGMTPSKSHETSVDSNIASTIESMSMWE